MSRVLDAIAAIPASLSFFALLFAGAAAYAQSDVCTEYGGTGICTGPEITPWKYQVGNGNGLVAQGATPSEAVANFQTQAKVGTCTFSMTDQLPTLPPITTGAGSRQKDTTSYPGALFDAQGDFWFMNWRLWTVYEYQRIPFRIDITYPQFVPPYETPCHSSRTYGAYLQGVSFASCPTGYVENNMLEYCVRAPTTQNPIKALGGEQCETLVGHPINVATGNKFLAEVDFRGSGEGVTFTRYYNSYKTKYYAPGDQKSFISSLGPSWQSTYERKLMYADSLLFPSAVAYRPDAKTVLFKMVNGHFVGVETDTTDRLVRLTDAGGATTGWEYFVGKTEEKESYGADGRLLSIRSRTGVMQTLSYTNGRLVSVADSFGRQLSFTYDSAGRLATLTDPGGGVVTYGYTANSNVNSVTYPNSTGRTYLYNEQSKTDNRNFPFALTGVLDEDGTRYGTYTYDALMRAVATELADGVDKYSMTYPQSAQFGQVTIQDPLMHQRTLTFATVQASAKMTSMSQPCALGCSNSFAESSYDVNGNAVSKTDFRGNKTCYAYQARNLESVRIEGFASGSVCPANLSAYTPATATRQRKITTQWNATYRLPAQIDEPGRRTNYTHDANGNVLTRTITDLTVTPNTARTWTYTYNAFGKVLTADGPRTDVSDVTTYTYYNCNTGYQCGQVNTITNALGHITTYNTYNAHGQPLTVTDPNGVITTLTYDARQRLTSRTVGSELTSFEYYPTGLLKKATLPDLSYLEYTYDAAHRLTDITDSEGNHIHYTLDAMGNRTNEQVFDSSQALSRTRTQVFNTLNQLWKTIGAAGGANVTTEYGYDNNGNQTSINAPLARNSTQTYDELNRLSSVTDPESGLTQYGYDALDQLISVTDPRGLVTSYTYNGLGDLKRQVSPDTNTTTNTYDSGGNLKTSTDQRSAITTYTYDALNRVKTGAFKIGTTTDQTINYSYDAGTNGKGKLSGASDSAHSMSWTYDDQGRTLTAGQTVGAVSKTTSYAYANGQRTSMTTPSGQLIGYGYTNGKLTSISVNGTTLLSNVLYDPFGPVRQWSWGNGTLSVRTFDQDGKITQVDSAGLKTYAYDDAFRITGITDTANAARSWTFGYDDLDRLTSATNNGATTGYSYDANGNRLTQTGSSASTYTVAANSNRLTSTTGALTRSYGYDGAGNTTSYTGITFAYNNRGRMKSSTKSGVTTGYTYNALGQLVKIGSRALMYYDEAGHILGIYNTSGALTEEIVWLGDTPVATLRPKTGGGVNIFYIHSDHLNAPRLVTQPNNNAVRFRWDLNAFGGGTGVDNPSGLGAFNFVLRSPGQMYVAETGLYYNYFRDYDPATGRYVQSDPIGLRGGLNTYAYVGGNPVSHIDPRGLAVYVCTRPVDVSWIPNWVARRIPQHMWIKTDTREAGMGGRCPVPGQACSDRPYTDTEVIDHTGQSNMPGAQCTLMQNVDEACVNRKLMLGTPTGNWNAMNQCNSVSQGIISSCRYGPQIGPQLPPGTLESHGPLGSHYSPR